MRGSYLAGLKYPEVAGWPDDDLVYFCEDDYLHQTQALVELTAAAVRLDSAHYFALYASTARHPLPQANKWHPLAEYMVGETLWVSVSDTTSTFGARIGTLRQDIGIFRQGLILHRNRIGDDEPFFVAQGRFPLFAKRNSSRLRKNEVQDRTERPRRKCRTYALTAGI